MAYLSIEDSIGKTPLVKIRRIGADIFSLNNNILLAKLEGNNPAGSVKDRAALSMIANAQMRGQIKPGDTLIEATSGNTGIALAMVAAIRGFNMVLIMPDNLSLERRQAIKAYGAQLVLVSQQQGIEYARDLAMQMQSEGRGFVLDQFSNDDNWRAHFDTTGPEIWADTNGSVTHFISAMGTTGTITGVSRFLKAQAPGIQIIGAQPTEGSAIPGIRKWPQAYLPAIYKHAMVDQIELVSQTDAEAMARRMAIEEGMFCGISAAGACCIAQRINAQEIGRAHV